MLNGDFNLIQGSNLSFSYAQNIVLDNISFDIKSGDYVGLIGPNGGGKTTLIKLILGILKPDQGTLNIHGTEIGYVPQKLTEGSVAFPASVLEIVENSIKNKKYFWQKKSTFEQKSIENVLEINDLGNLKHRLIGELSGGQRQRVLLARALVNQPKVLILDEPTVGVDTKTQDKFYQFLKHLNQSHKMTIIFVSHDLSVVASQTNRILCLNQKLVEHDNPKDLLNQDFISGLYGPNFKFIQHTHH